MNMKRQHIVFAFIVVYLWAIIILLGATLYETFIIYPNMFHDVPRTLELSQTFLNVRSPGDFFRPTGMGLLLIGIVTTILIWRVPSIRYYILGSLLLIIAGQVVLTPLFFFPRSTILFTEGAAVHSLSVLQNTANEFQAGSLFRVLNTIVFSILAFIGLLKYERLRIASQFRHQHPEMLGFFSRSSANEPAEVKSGSQDEGIGNG
jgi:hypothetical protein